jgi:hypothetical protein
MMQCTTTTTTAKSRQSPKERERERENALIKTGEWVPTSSGKRIKEKKADGWIDIPDSEPALPCPALP